MEVTLRIRRFNPEKDTKPYWGMYTLKDCTPTSRILELLHRVKWEQDGTLTLRRSCAQGICGFEVVEVSPPYDTSDITALMGVRVVVEALGSLVAHGKLGSHKSIINKPVTY